MYLATVSAAVDFDCVPLSSTGVPGQRSTVKYLVSATPLSPNSLKWGVGIY